MSAPIARGSAESQAPSPNSVLVGVFPGEGVGPDLTAICARLLHLLAETGAFRLRVEYGGPIGLEARRQGGADLPETAADFAADILARGGAILAGPGGGRFVYDLRRRLDLFVKLNPLRRFRGAVPAGREFDIMVVRDNREGLYQGESTETAGGVRHTFECSVPAVDAITERAARLASSRRGSLAVIVKESGLPAVSRIWRESAEAAGARHGVAVSPAEMDYAVYRLVREPATFDVLAAPNCYGDLLSDLGGALMGSRGVTYGASFDPTGRGVYQTNHGSAHDLKGRDMANPAGQMLALSMLLRESFGLGREADSIEAALEDTWAAGWKTFDMEELPGGPHRVCGTRAFASEVERNLLARVHSA